MSAPSLPHPTSGLGNERSVQSGDRPGAHFISGLPRSGSTLLSAVLRQNPRFQASVTTPVLPLWSVLLNKMSAATEFGSFFDQERKLRMLKAAFSGYHGIQSPNSVMFDTNRAWTGKAALLQKVFPGSKIICCVREVAWVIDSVESMLRKNPLEMSKVFNFKPGLSVYARAEVLMNSDTGLVGLPWANLREAWFSECAPHLIVVRYEEFIKYPAATMDRLYDFIGEPVYKHDFANVVYDEPDYDADLGMPGLHKVRQKIEAMERQSCIPPDLYAKYENANFWLDPKLNRRGVAVI